MQARQPSNPFMISAVAGLVGLGLALRFPPATEGRILVFMGFVVLTELLSVELAGGRRFSLGLAPALGYAFVAEHTMAGASAVAVVYLAGALAGVVVRMLARRPEELQKAAARIAARLIVVIAASVAYSVTDQLAGAWTPFGDLSVTGLLAVLAAVVAFEPPLQLLSTGLPAGHAPMRVLAGSVRTAFSMQVATVSVGALLGLSYPFLGAWSLPLFLAPLAATQYSFRQFASIRRTYVQTIRALSRVPEMAGYTRPGHSTRVAELSVAMAQDLGIAADRIGEIEYAALLHDIGRVALSDPESTNETASRLELALVGSSIVEETGYFPRVARMIREQIEPYRRRGEVLNRDIMPGAKIIKVASAYDDLTKPAGLGRAPWDAIDRLHTGTAHEFDPNVIQALTRVLERRGDI